MVCIIDYKAGNAPSVYHAVSKLGFPAVYADKPKMLRHASCIILPGVGSAGATMESLQKLSLFDDLHECVLVKKIPFLGVCVGHQILFQHSEEDNTDCLGWLEGGVRKFDSISQRVPQMGWNYVSFKQSALAAKDGYYYFVNSYYAAPMEEASNWGYAEYGTQFNAAVQKDNIYGTQFHIEKSGVLGLSLLKEFITHAH
ncbi:MAG: imidazole glycerol phosphate synthase subunit HisH [Treponema sp.]|nr:imidazole glycerol phosphate synthase subunit HisH [Treponema sp.]